MRITVKPHTLEILQAKAKRVHDLETYRSESTERLSAVMDDPTLEIPERGTIVDALVDEAARRIMRADRIEKAASALLDRLAKLTPIGASAGSAHSAALALEDAIQS